MSNEVAKTNEYKTMLVQANDTYLGMIERQMSDHNVTMSEYGKVCVLNAVGAINDLLVTNGLSFHSKDLDTSTLTTALLTVATLQLNAKAVNREIYFQLRNKKVGDAWIKVLEWGIEGDGWDALIARFGRDVKKVYPYWIVRSGDKYTPTRRKGLEVFPPEWEESGEGEVVRVVYPIVFKDGSVNYYSCEKNDVLKNLYAHINNNLMNETFGICKDRFKATDEQKVQIAEKKKEVLEKAKSLGWAALDDNEISKFISPSWTEYHSRESMIIRKMRNRICKAIPKDLGTAYESDIFNKAVDENYATIIDQIDNNANVELLDVPTIDDTTGEVKPNF